MRENCSMTRLFVESLTWNARFVVEKCVVNIKNSPLDFKINHSYTSSFIGVIIEQLSSICKRHCP